MVGCAPDPSKSPCPVCNKVYSTDFMESHVEFCIEKVTTCREIQASGSSFFAVRTKVAKEEKSIEVEPRAPRWLQGENLGTKRFPQHKRVAGTNFIVDGFDWGHQEWCTGYFLSHFHSDHYRGLKKTFDHPIYCSSATGNLIVSRIKVVPSIVRHLSLGEEYEVDGIRVRLLDANHCPGSVMFLFSFPNSTHILHTGDCRADSGLIENVRSLGLNYTFVYLDTTYCSPQYIFPTQSTVIRSCCSAVQRIVDQDRNRLAPIRRLIVVGTYLIGKERLAIALANQLNCLLYVDRAKRLVLDQLEWDGLAVVLTDDPEDTALHIVHLGLITKEGLSKLIEKFQLDQIIGVKPTGWTCDTKSRSASIASQMYDHVKRDGDGNITKRLKDAIVMLQVPYSEHSSYAELCEFADELKFDAIVPTVSNPKDRVLYRRDYLRGRDLISAWSDMIK